MTAVDPIRGRRILVTRPAERAGPLVAAIAEAGGEAIRFPTIEIVPQSPGSDAIAAARTAAALLFVSPAAVAHGIDALGLRPDTAPPLGGVGPGTLAALRARGFHATVEPVGSADSEGLLQAPQLAPDRVAGRRIVIVRGRGGREMLANGLMARGAAVDYAEVYRRERPRAPDPALATGCDIVTATSNEGLANLLAMLDDGGRAAVRGKPLAVASERTATMALARGFGRPEIADRPGDEGLLAAIRRCASHLPHGPSEPA